MKTLTTERTILRTFMTDDTPDVFEYAKSLDVGPYAGWKPHKSIEETQTIVENFISENEVWAIVFKETGRVVGSVGLHKDAKRTFAANTAKELGYVLSPKYWNRGIITEVCKEVLRFAFETMKLETVSVGHFDFNPRSMRVIEKLGFKYEGTLRNAAYNLYGELCDELVYSKTKEEYFSGK